MNISKLSMSEARKLQSSDLCRTVQISDAYCDESSTGCNPDDAVLKLDFSFAYEAVASEELCCSACVCWGDPRCTSFDGSRANWIICDDRRASNCLHGPVRCENQKDPWGNKCEYVRNTRVPNSEDDKPWWYSWDQSGSPCQSTSIWEGTKFPTMIMYEGSDQVITLTLGERGIVSALNVTQTSGETFAITSTDCLADSSASAWTSSSSSSIPSTWTVTVESDSRTRWSIQNDDASAFTSILCQATSDYRSRLDVNIKVPTAGDAPLSSSGDGFCNTGTISEDAKGTGTLSVEQDDECLREELGGCIEACKALVDATCLESNLETHVRYWCDMNDYAGVLPAINSTEDCVSRIIDEENCTETSYNWADIVCQIDNMNSDKSGYDESGYLQCLADIEDFTWFQYVQDRPSYSVVSSGSAPTECISDVIEYSKSKPYDCAVGVQVQSLNPETGDYDDEFFIPVDSPPCDDVLNISGADFPNIMTRPIRLVQCESLQSQCAIENSCLPTNGFEVSFEYTMKFCPTSKPTQSPTLTPTSSPTLVPTDAPTLAPTKVPSAAPTSTPTLTPTPESDYPRTGSPVTTEEASSCYECSVGSGRQPEICTTDDVYMYLGQCETCCQSDATTLPELTEYGYCRTQETERAYCNMTDSNQAQWCEQLDNHEGTLEINITYASAEDVPLSCCPDCSVYGDPELISFKTTSFNISAWIICDGRVQTEDDEACPIEEDTCISEVDHNGNACYYNKTRAELISSSSQANIGAIGSPCQANPASGPAVMEVYTIPGGDFAINTILGERAVVNAAVFTVGGNNYTLTASDCFGGAGSGWDASIVNVLQNVTFDNEDQNPTVRGATRSWSFVYDETIYVEITCLKMIAQGGDAEGITGYRLDLDHIIDVDEDRATGDTSNATGFCPTDVINFQQATPTKVGADSVFYDCTWQQWSMALTLAKALVAPATIDSTAEIKSAVQTWCKTANVFTTSNDASAACFSKIWGSGTSMVKVGERWTEQYCTAISSKRGTWTLKRWNSQCTSDIYQETFGITTYVAMYGTGEVDTDNTCMSDPSYTTSDNICTEGIFVEYYDETSGSWVEEFFVPSLSLPCNGLISLSYSDYPNLFQNKIRFRQCDQQANNGCSLAYSCMSAQGFEVSYKFSHSGDICGTSS